MDRISFPLSLAPAAAPAILVSFVTARILYRLFLHPLSHIPGPLLARSSNLFLYVISYLGVEGRVLRYYHQSFDAKVIRIAPNHVSVSDVSAVQQIYVSGGGLQKDERYSNFNLGPVVTIFSSRDTAYRDLRAKAVAPLFATRAVRAACEPRGVIGESINQFVSQLARIKALARSHDAADVKADILDLSARLSIDVVTGYLLKDRYGGLEENVQYLDGGAQGANLRPKLSANHFIFAIVAFSRFSLLPHWLFGIFYAISSNLSSTEQFKSSLVRIHEFARRVTDHAAGPNANTQESYPSRLLAAGISKEEIIAQCEAVMFAGTDSTGVSLATIIFHLVQNPAARDRLAKEFELCEDPAVDPQSLPYLRSVVKEGLRLSMANPTRLTRTVPAGGLQFGDTYVPSGAVVGSAAYMLHHDPEIFPEPFKFMPERWPEDDDKMGRETGGRRAAEMGRSLLSFGAGGRACLGKTLATYQLYAAVRALVESRVLDGARTCKESIEIIEWFNAEIKGHELEIEWPMERGKGI